MMLASRFGLASTRSPRRDTGFNVSTFFADSASVDIFCRLLAWASDPLPAFATIVCVRQRLPAAGSPAMESGPVCVPPSFRFPDCSAPGLAIVRKMKFVICFEWSCRGVRSGTAGGMVFGSSSLRKSAVKMASAIATAKAGFSYSVPPSDGV